MKVQQDSLDLACLNFRKEFIKVFPQMGNFDCKMAPNSTLATIYQTIM